MKKIKPAFTLIELLVVIAIIGIISTLAVVSLTNARQSARDAKRIADIKQIQTSLELYYQDNNEYPTTITDSIATSGIIYMQTYPTAPTPADGDCSDSDNAYTYTVSGTENSSYSLTFCLGNNTNDLSAGPKKAIPGGITVPWVCGDNFVDSRDSNEYSTVKIGTQCWMKKNMNIGNMINSSLDQTKNSTIEKYCFNNLENNCNTYGGLYQWNEAIQYSTTTPIQGICPTDWHIPSDDNWTTLITFLGGASVAGGKMKETGTTHWSSPNTGADNSSGFTALSAGYRLTDYSFNGFGYDSSFWSSLESTPTNSWRRILYHNGANIGRFSNTKAMGFSVRCLKN